MDELLATSFGTCRAASGGHHRDAFDEEVVGPDDQIPRHCREIVEWLVALAITSSSVLTTMTYDAIGKGCRSGVLWVYIVIQRVQGGEEGIYPTGISRQLGEIFTRVHQSTPCIRQRE